MHSRPQAPRDILVCRHRATELQQLATVRQLLLSPVYQGREHNRDDSCASSSRATAGVLAKGAPLEIMSGLACLSVWPAAADAGPAVAADVVVVLLDLLERNNGVQNLKYQQRVALYRTNQTYCTLLV